MAAAPFESGSEGFAGPSVPTVNSSDTTFWLFAVETAQFALIGLSYLILLGIL